MDHLFGSGWGVKLPYKNMEEEENITEKVKLILDKTNLYQSDVIVKMFVNLIYAEKQKARLEEREDIKLEIKEMQEFED